MMSGEVRGNPGHTHNSSYQDVYDYTPGSRSCTLIDSTAPQGVNDSTLEDLCNSDHDSLISQKLSEDDAASDRAADSRARAAQKERDLCTLKTDLSAKEAQQLLPDDGAFSETVTNDSLAGKFGGAFDSGTSSEKRKIKDKMNLLCTYSSIKLVQRWLFFIAGAVTLMFMAIGGLLWITAGDSDDRAKKARGFLLSALGGFAIVLLSAALLSIVRFIIG